MKKKLLYVGHAYHNKTKSTHFLLDMFAEIYEVIKFDFDPYCDSFEKFEELAGNVFDIVILFQIMPSLSYLKKYIKSDKFIFFPMYDGAPPLTDDIWYEYKDCNIINFSKTLHDECKRVGLSSYYIQYFPKPEPIENWGDEFSIFLWQRLEKISPNLLEKLLEPEKINMLYLHQVPDPSQKVIEPSESWNNKVKISKWFDTKEELKAQIAQASIYIAPRHLEGIGMSFLEAMAMGRCVIAPNNPTMNEYIKDGITGFLYDVTNPQKIELKNIRKIQRNTFEYIEKGYKKWEKSKYKILDWLESDVNSNRNISKIEKYLTKYEIKKKQIKISITYLKKKITNTHKIYYLFGFMPIYKKRRK